MDTSSSQPPLPPPPPTPPTPPQTINTYHCLCTHLLLATTHTLSRLPRRKAPGLDNALILPLPPPPPTSSTSIPEESPSRSRSRSPSSSSSAETSDNDQHPKQPHRPKHPHRAQPRDEDHDRSDDYGYSILLSAMLDRKAVVVRREDGFEKRYLWRCGRCRLVVGYQVDEVHFVGRGGVKGKERDGEGEGEGEGEGGRRGRVVYLLPGGLVGTGEMKVGGRAVGDEEGWV